MRLRGAVIFAGSAFLLWLLLLVVLQATAHALNRPAGFESLADRLAMAWSLIILVPVVASCVVAAWQAERRCLSDAAIVFIAATLPSAYVAYTAFAGAERALSDGRFTAAAINYTFAVVLIYPAVAVGAAVGFVLACAIRRRRGF